MSLQRLRGLTSLPVAGRSLGCWRGWYWAEVSAREPGGPDDSDPWGWIITGERPLTGETGLSGEAEMWQLFGERVGGGAWGCGGLGDGLWGGDGSLCGVRDWAVGEWEPLDGTDADASRRLRANRALLVLAEFFWAESVGLNMSGWPGSGSMGWPPEPAFSLSEDWELSATLDQLSSHLPSLPLALSPPSRPPPPTSQLCWPFCFSGWTDRSSSTPRTEKNPLLNTFCFLSNQFHSLVKALKS